VLQRGGIQYYHWQTVMGGDGFDMMVDSSDNRFGYAMSQGGNWTLISPDLTTNDPEKLKQNQTGGLTYDITGAENHCTIIATTPSPLQKDEIWVGTDDGNLQLTRDGGSTWANLTENIKGAPKNGWIPQIHVSNQNPGEAFVVINNYRQNDFESYLFYTKNYGKNWSRMVDDTKVSGYCLSVIQDPVEPNLIFLGTESGLYVSIDYGVNWTKWTRGYPTVPTMDLKIHPREQDLIIATFGRSVYIIDDVRPQRQIAKQGISVLDKEITAFPSPVAYRIGSKSQATAQPAAGARMGGEPGGMSVFPGKYMVKYSCSGQSDSTWIEVQIDPRVPYLMSDLVTRKEYVLAFQKKVDKLTAAMELIKQAQDAVDLVTKEIPAGRSEELRTLRQETKTIKDTLAAMMNRISPERPTETQRASPAEYNLVSKVTRALASASDGFDALSNTQKIAVELAEKELKKMLDQVDLFFTTTWPAFKETVSKSSVSPFNDKPWSKISW